MVSCPRSFKHLLSPFWKPENFNLFEIGDKALSQILEDARKVAERCTDPADRDRILKTVGDIDSMKNALSELRVQGKVR